MKDKSTKPKARFNWGYFAYARRKMQGQMQGFGGLFGVGRSRAERYQKSSSDVTFKDVAGLENAKKELQESNLHMIM